MSKVAKLNSIIPAIITPDMVPNIADKVFPLQLFNKNSVTQVVIIITIIEDKIGE